MGTGEQKYGSFYAKYVDEGIKGTDFMSLPRCWQSTASVLA